MMNYRYPAVPLITHSPYFNIWAMDDVPNRKPTCHWTGKPNPLYGTMTIGKKSYCFLGCTGDYPMRTVSVEVGACTTKYVMTSPEAQLTACFTSPLLLDDLKVMARPVTYLTVTVEPRHGYKLEDISIKVGMDELIGLNTPKQHPTEYAPAEGKLFTGASLASCVQEPLNCSGDDVRIDWGRMYLSVEKEGKAELCEKESGKVIEASVCAAPGQERLFTFAYDEIKCIRYFGNDLDPLWKEESSDILEIIDNAIAEFPQIRARCRKLAEELWSTASEAGGEKYAQLLSAAYRQVIAAHGICRDEAGKILFISKECFSNGCAATADVSYPSIPLFLLYQPELIFGMMRPVMKFAATPAWPFDFAPHDAGQYPLVNGQVYSGGIKIEGQMPIEECGNMLIMTAAATLASNDDSFAAEYWELLTKWAEYLKANGLDPENQLCTDDFAGHLAHNCNLSIKAILGVASYGLLMKRRGDESGGEWIKEARSMAAEWVKMADNGDGTYRLAFDRPDTFSMKYNAVWDELFGTEVFPAGTWDKELKSYIGRLNPYGMPLDNRADYTKSDWLIWVASMMKSKEDFEKMADSIWNAYNEMPQRVPMSDWFDTLNTAQMNFQNRTVQGGLFIRILTEKGKM